MRRSAAWAEDVRVESPNEMSRTGFMNTRGHSRESGNPREFDPRFREDDY